MRRKFLSSVAAAAAGVAIASLGTLSGASAAEPTLNWTGFYLNGGAGYGLWTADTSTSKSPGSVIPTLPETQRRGGQGALGRVGGGYDHQFNSRIVGGVFADFDFTNIKGTIQDAVVGLSEDVKLSWSWAAGARVGWLATPQILTYVNTGFSSARFSSGSMTCFLAISAPFCSGYTTPAFTANGWLLGGGVESALGGGWFWRNEYRYAYYGSHAIPVFNTFSANATPRYNDINFKPQVQTFTTQVVYKFNSGAPGGRSDSNSAREKPVQNWTGFNVYGGVGYGQWTAKETTSSVPGNGGEPPMVNELLQGGRGWLGRVGAGYDHQLSAVVVGAFADFDFSRLRGTISQPANVLAGDISQQWSWAAGGRAGLIVTPSLLGYLNGGYTSAHFSSSTMNDIESPNAFWGAPGVQATTAAFTRSGWFIGGGTEYAMTSLLGLPIPLNGLFWRNEYRYASYGTRSLAPTLNATGLAICGGCSINSINFKPAVQTVTTELVYRFGSVR